MNYWKRLRVRLAGLLRAVRQVGRAERILQDRSSANRAPPAPRRICGSVRSCPYDSCHLELRTTFTTARKGPLRIVTCGKHPAKESANVSRRSFGEGNASRYRPDHG
jgi:hypothetical protein